MNGTQQLSSAHTNPFYSRMIAVQSRGSANTILWAEEGAYPWASWYGWGGTRLRRPRRRRRPPWSPSAAHPWTPCPLPFPLSLSRRVDGRMDSIRRGVGLVWCGVTEILECSAHSLTQMGHGGRWCRSGSGPGWLVGWDWEPTNASARSYGYWAMGWSSRSRARRRWQLASRSLSAITGCISSYGPGP
jgi:hypothetical protein